MCARQYVRMCVCCSLIGMCVKRRVFGMFGMCVKRRVFGMFLEYIKYWLKTTFHTGQKQVSLVLGQSKIFTGSK